MHTEPVHARTAVPRMPGFAWLRPWLWAWLLLALPAAAQETAAGQPHSAFTPLELEFQATTMALTEDGNFLVVAHEQDNRLTIWDVKTDKKLKTLPCPAPRHLFCTTGKVYVANYGKGTVSVYAPDHDWDLENEALVGNPGVFQLAAPLGPHFDGKLLASCFQNGRGELRLVDTRKDVNSSLLEIHPPATTEMPSTACVITLDAAGKRFALRRMFSSYETTGLYEQLITRKAVIDWNGPHSESSLRRQVEPRWWIGYPGWMAEKRIFYGDSPVLIGFSLGSLVIPDRHGVVAYALKDNAVNILRLDMALSRLASIPVSFPEDIAEPPQVNASDMGTALVALCPPEAVRHGDDAFLFVKKNGQILRVCLKGAFAGLQIRPRQPLAEPLELAPLPAQVVEEQPLRFPLFAKPATGSFSILRGPPGATVAADGTFSWTPTAKDVGPASFSILSNVDGDRDVHALQFEVVAKELGLRAQTDDGTVLFAKHKIDATLPCSLATLADGSGILMLNGDRLQILDADGLQETASFPLPGLYKKILARPGYLVALADQAVDLLDPKDGHTIKHFPMPGQRTDDLVLNPAGPWCYVAINNPGPEDDEESPESSTVLCLDEASGRTSTMPGLCGQALAIDPRGELLYVLMRPLPSKLPFWKLQDRAMEGRRDEEMNTLACYDLFGPAAIYREKNIEAGKNYQSLCLCADGRRICYGSSGYIKDPRNPMAGFGHHVAVFSGDKPQHRENTFLVENSPESLSFNPRLDIVAVAAGKSIQLFGPENLHNFNSLLVRPAPATGEPKGVFFTPSGRFLMFRCENAAGEQYVYSVHLKLNKAQLEQIRQTPALPPPLVATAERQALQASLALPPKAIVETLAKPKEATMPPGTFRETCQRAVVLIHDDRISGSGCFVSGDGYILGTFDAIPRFGELKVLFWGPDNNGFVKREAKARLVAADEKQGLALMKIDPGPGQVEYLRLDRAVKENDPVLVFGQLNQGNLSLDYGQVQGVVVQANSLHNDLPFIQANHALNLRYSGAPALNTRGNAIGLVASLRGEDDAAWIIPAARLLEFLKANSR